MPDLDWNALTRLSGSPDRNFEHLTYELVRRHYGRFGTLVFPSNATGVEFTLELSADCDLGAENEVVAWQCKWYHPVPGLNGSRRSAIADSFKKSMARAKPPTRWILCTPHAFSETEEDWLHTQVPGWIEEVRAAGHAMREPRVDHWRDVDFDLLMRPPHDVVAAAWLGEFVLPPEWFRSHIARSTARLQATFLADLHVSTEIEDPLHEALGDERARERMADAQQTASAIAVNARSKATEYRDIRSSGTLAWSEADDAVESIIIRLASHADELAQSVAHAREHLAAGRVEQAIAMRPAIDVAAAKSLSADLYTAAADLAASIGQTEREAVEDWASSAADLAYRHSELAEDIARRLDTLAFPLVAAVGRRGRGKSHLAASAASGFGGAPVGILLQGMDFDRRFHLEDLPRMAGLPGQPLEGLIAALHAAGLASGQRSLIVVDAINESADPSDWSTRLPELEAVVARYPNVLVLVTTRPTYADLIWPASRPPALSVNGFGGELAEATERYFDHYKILVRGDQALTFFRDPLLLRIFCEATNRERTHEVEVDVDEISVDELFETLVDNVERTIATKRGEDHRARRVRQTLVAIGARMWEERSRFVPFLAAKDAAGDRPEAGIDSLLHDILREDFLLAREAEGTDELVYFPLDRLAGHFIAAHLLEAAEESGRQLTRDQNVIDGLCDEDPAHRHPLREDILAALAHMSARRGAHLYESAEADCLKVAGLRALGDLPAAMVPSSAESAIREWWARSGPDERWEILDFLDRHARRPAHPLNFHLTASLLTALSMPERDVTWSEWLRLRQSITRDEVARQEELVKGESASDEEVDLILAWSTWLLTTTVRDLRDHATRVLYWIGRTYADKLFEATRRAHEIDDPYVRERMLAASYGVAMARGFEGDAAFDKLLGDVALDLYSSMLVEAATTPTTHRLARDYARWTVWLARRTGAVSGDLAEPSPPFAHSRRAWGSIERDTAEYEEIAGAIQMDFENYTIGRLVEGRANYNMDHPAYREVLNAIRWRIRDLGYRRALFDPADREVRDRWLMRDGEGKIDRYGKKYGWIALHEMEGRLEDEGRLPSRRWAEGHGPDADIDPSFPQPVPPVGVQLGDWLGEAETPDLDWLRHDEQSTPDELIVASSLDGEPGPWVLAWAQISQGDDLPGRRVFSLVPCGLVSEDDVPRVTRDLQSVSHPGRWALPEPLPHHYIYAGEIPWNPLFAPSEEDSDPQQVGTGLSNEYAWESYHSSLNEAGGAIVPTREFAEMFQLHGAPQTFDLFEADGQRATISCRPDAPWRGSLLYLRGDLLARYIASRGGRLVWIAWGERELLDDPPRHHVDPQVAEIYERNENMHRRVLILDTAAMSPVLPPGASTRLPTAD